MSTFFVLHEQPLRQYVRSVHSGGNYAGYFANKDTILFDDANPSQSEYYLTDDYQQTVANPSVGRQSSHKIHLVYTVIREGCRVLCKKQSSEISSGHSET